MTSEIVKLLINPAKEIEIYCGHLTSHYHAALGTMHFASVIVDKIRENDSSRMQCGAVHASGFVHVTVVS